MSCGKDSINNNTRVNLLNIRKRQNNEEYVHATVIQNIWDNLRINVTLPISPSTRARDVDTPKLKLSYYGTYHIV